MKIPFRQGLVNFQVDGFGQAQYLTASTTAGFVSLNVAPTPTVVAFAHGSSDYLQVFASGVANAWGPVQSGLTSYLYWEIDLLTANVSYGFTTTEPVVSSVEPVNPPAPNGTAVFHWFDIANATMKIWNGSAWRTVVRAFAGRVNGSTSNLTAEPRGQSWRQALPVEGSPGYIATDIFNNPIRTVAGEFVTTASPVRFKNTSGTSGVLAVLPNAYIPVRASENIPAMSLVYFSGESEVGLATGNPAINPPRIPIGVVQDALTVNEVGVVTQAGEITYDQWDWSSHIGKPVYCGGNGEIVTTRPNGLLAYRVGFVKDRKTVLFQVDAETFPQVYQAQANDIIINAVAPLVSEASVNGLGERLWSITLPPATDSQSGHMTAAQATALDTLEVRVTDVEADVLDRALIGHVHDISDVTTLQTALDGKSPIGHNHDELYAPISHNHDGYHAPVVHNHTIPDVQGLQTALNAKIDAVSTAPLGTLSSFIAGGQLESAGVTVADLAFANHTHAIANVTGLQVALDGKAPVGHSHLLDELLDVSAPAPMIGQALVWDGTSWISEDVGGTQSLVSQTIVLNIPAQAEPTAFLTPFDDIYGSSYVDTYISATYPGLFPGTFDYRSNFGPLNPANSSSNAVFFEPNTVGFSGEGSSVSTNPVPGSNKTAIFDVRIVASGISPAVSVGVIQPSAYTNPNASYANSSSAITYSPDGTINVLGNVTMVDAYGNGDYIGVVVYQQAGGYGDSFVHFFKNGVLVFSTPLLLSLNDVYPLVTTVVTPI